MIKKILLLFGSVILIWLIWIIGKFFIMPSFMPKILIENQIGEKIEIYGPQYEERLGGSVENLDMSVARYFTYPVGKVDSNEEASLGFWRRYNSSEEIIEWRVSWYYDDFNKDKPEKSISRATFYIDEKGDYCHIKLIMTLDGKRLFRSEKTTVLRKFIYRLSLDKAVI